MLKVTLSSSPRGTSAPDRSVSMASRAGKSPGKFLLTREYSPIALVFSWLKNKNDHCQQTCCGPKILDSVLLKGRHDRYRIVYADRTGSEVGTVGSFKVF